MPINAVKQKRNTQPCSAMVASVEQSSTALPADAVELRQTQAYGEKLRCGRAFLNLVLINVATGINQHRLRQM